MKTFLLGLVIFFSFEVQSQTPSFSPYFSAIIVSDIEKSAEWYAEVFSASIENRYEHEEHGIKIINLDAGNYLIELLQLRDAKAREGRSHGIFKVGFLVDDILTWEKRLKALDIQLHGELVYDEKIKKRMLIFKDPDGNYLQLFQDHQ